MNTLKNINYYLAIIVTVWFTGCVEKNKEKQEQAENTKNDNLIKINLQLDEIEIDNPQISISYHFKGTKDTLRELSNKNYIKKPSFDTTLTFFQVKHRDFKAELAGLFLQDMLPILIDSSVSDWYIKIDTPPFKEKYPYLDSVDYSFEIWIDSVGHSGVLLHGKK